jgi:UDP-N-acetylglucosamine acyltransferase
VTAHPQAVHPSAVIHPSAQIDPSATIAEGCIIESGAVVGPNCVIGPRTRLRHHSVIVEHTTLGEANDVHPFATLGGDPQDRAFKGDIRGELHIGNSNIFREGVTLSRGTNNGPPTRIGNNNYFMTQSHAGHNAQVGDNNILANCAALAGHVRLGNNCVMSSYSAVHQFVNIGDGVMFQATGGMSMHVPPFVVVAGINAIVGINRIGLKRNPIYNEADRRDIKDLVRAMFRDRGAAPMLATAESLLASRTWGLAGNNFLGFIISALKEQGPRARGVCGMLTRATADAVAAE